MKNLSISKGLITFTIHPNSCLQGLWTQGKANISLRWMKLPLHLELDYTWKSICMSLRTEPFWAIRLTLTWRWEPYNLKLNVFFFLEYLCDWRRIRLSYAFWCLLPWRMLQRQLWKCKTCELDLVAWTAKEYLYKESTLIVDKTLMWKKDFWQIKELLLHELRRRCKVSVDWGTEHALSLF